jgi:hypothetical protein
MDDTLQLGLWDKCFAANLERANLFRVDQLIQRSAANAQPPA